MDFQEMNLNIRYDLPRETWKTIIPAIYAEMDGWMGFGTDETHSRQGCPHWFSFNENEKYVCASVEPGGLHFFGRMNDNEWEDWKAKIKRIATKKLGFKVGKIELGEVDY